MQRFFLALHATLPAALLVAVLAHLFPPAGLAPLAQRPVWTVWALIGAWLLLSALAAWALRTFALWRVSLGGAGTLLAVAGLLGRLQGGAHATAMLAGLVAVGGVCLGMASFVGPQRVQAPRRTATHQGPSAGRSRFAVPGHLPFWLSGVLALESFRLAHVVATEPARASGMLGLLLAFFVALPAATLRHWTPRTAALLWALAALAYGGLASKAGLVQWAVASVLCAMAAGMQLRRRSGAA
jgi:hypothetical protein